MFATHLRLLAFLGTYKRHVVIAWIAVFLTAVFTMITPQLLRFAIDSGLKPPTFKDSGVRLEEAMQSSDTQVVLQSPLELQPGDEVRLGGESVSITAVNDGVLTVERGAEGTKVKSHDSGTKVELVDRATFEGKTSTLALAAGLLIVVAFMKGMSSYCHAVQRRMAEPARGLRPAQPHLRQAAAAELRLPRQRPDGPADVARHAGRRRRRACSSRWASCACWTWCCASSLRRS